MVIPSRKPWLSTWGDWVYRRLWTCPRIFWRGARKNANHNRRIHIYVEEWALAQFYTRSIKHTHIKLIDRMRKVMEEIIAAKRGRLNVLNSESDSRNHNEQWGGIFSISNHLDSWNFDQKYTTEKALVSKGKNWKSDGGGRNCPERSRIGFRHHYRNIWHLSIENLCSFNNFEKIFSSGSGEVISGQLGIWRKWTIF